MLHFENELSFLSPLRNNLFGGIVGSRIASPILSRRRGELLLVIALGLFELLSLPGYAQTTDRVSVSSNGFEGNLGGGRPSISGDGRYVAFSSRSTNLVFFDGNSSSDIFLHDSQSGSTKRISVGLGGLEANDWSDNPSISADGLFIAFSSKANNLVQGDINGQEDIFVQNRVDGTISRVSVDSQGRAGNYPSRNPSISGDGRFVAFSSEANNLVQGDTNYRRDIFVHDCLTGRTQRVSVNSQGMEGNEASYSPSISSDGKFVSFGSASFGLVQGDTNWVSDVFVHDLQTGLTSRVSLNSQGVEGNDWSGVSSISANGRFVAYTSRADNLVVGDNNSKHDVFIHDLGMGQTLRVSLDFEGNEATNGGFLQSSGALSADGSQVAFSSDNLVPGDTDGIPDLYVRDWQSGVTERVSVSSFGVEGDAYGWASGSLSQDGQFVVFESSSAQLVSGDMNGFKDVFVRDRWNGRGQNSIYLSGPSTASVGNPLQLSWFTARPHSHYRLSYSQNTNGSFIRWHFFDIGAPRFVLATGVNSSNGSGGFTLSAIPVSAAGVTLFFEVAAQSLSGVIYDSNALAITIS